MEPYAIKECSDKLALINFAVYNIQQLKNNGTSENEIKLMLSEKFNFSDELIGQII